MSAEARKLLEDAVKLPHRERVALVEALCDSLADEPATLSPEWTSEIAGRIEQLEQGEVQAIPWSEVEARIRRTLG